MRCKRTLFGQLALPKPKPLVEDTKFAIVVGVEALIVAPEIAMPDPADNVACFVAN